MLYVIRVARLAQLAEQLTLNQLVRGSSPRPGTIAFLPLILIFKKMGVVSFRRRVFLGALSLLASMITLHQACPS